ncbi:glycerol 3-phosphate dehydrogenase (NAD(P)+) [Desulfurobacterium pacificum]|uniref:Glycerol-3-phosphate dehydrogenase [NAD(P)+] n=1 Tax=Desulfurobacterium pacificum TaxID=240166 RepID=A0ABY1NDJ7_9BACT|nr:NAD(P)H-dependent glycerol-3-phosphate dehydrogenase [Desulfurobacterium pacificum]SMP07116.1 glycerol 3-phosphate dehydrogenase (NAD(P)+) [Desulfurobacterium pacificum]
MKIAILGSGSWGTALTIHFGRNGFEVIQWCREKEIADSINRERKNPLYLPSILYPETVKATISVKEAVENAQFVFSVIPVQFTGSLWKENKEVLKDKTLICASKGIEISSLKTLSEVYKEIFGTINNYYVLSGPTFAEEIAKGLPAAAVVAGKDRSETLKLVKTLSTVTFRLYASTDIKGVELGGALKNVVAIATGISDGMGLGNNARAAIITRGLHEIKKLGKLLGAKEETFYGLSGLGDLVLTCTGDLSRNRQFGLAIGRGEGKVDEKFVVEGVHTVEAVYRLAKELNVEMPIVNAVYKIVHERQSPQEVMKELLSRPVKEETT